MFKELVEHNYENKNLDNPSLCKVIISVCQFVRMSDHNSLSNLPICLKIIVWGTQYNSPLPKIPQTSKTK